MANHKDHQGHEEKRLEENNLSQRRKGGRAIDGSSGGPEGREVVVGNLSDLNALAAGRALTLLAVFLGLESSNGLIQVHRLPTRLSALSELLDQLR
jgi:hypothetical protein